MDESDRLSSVKQFMDAMAYQRECAQIRTGNWLRRPIPLRIIRVERRNLKSDNEARDKKFHC